MSNIRFRHLSECSHLLLSYRCNCLSVLYEVYWCRYVGRQAGAGMKAGRLPPATQATTMVVDTPSWQAGRQAAGCRNMPQHSACCHGPASTLTGAALSDSDLTSTNTDHGMWGMCRRRVTYHEECHRRCHGDCPKWCIGICTGVLHILRCVTHIVWPEWAAVTAYISTTCSENASMHWHRNNNTSATRIHPGMTMCMYKSS